MLPNTGKLAGCTLFITGGSRGIGKAIALKAARDGANIVIAAKTASPHPKLPGTIYTAAQEVEAAGGKALACVVDIRDEQQIGEAVEKAVSKFGGIDVLVNNASAISLTGTLETPMKKVDLMLGVNLRGTYLTSKLVIPHLLKSHNPHILNLAPPLNLNPVWFKNHTAIQTAAMDMLGGDGIGKQCRTADIMADAAYAVLSQPKDYTGQFLVDEDVLKKEGIRDFDPYAVQKGHPLLPDFFLDEAPDDLVEKMEEHGATPAFKPPSSSSAPPSAGGPIESTFEVIKGVINEDVVKSTQGIYQFDLSGEHAGVWFLDLKSGAGSVGHGEPSVKADVIMKMDSSDFSKMFAGKLKPTMAFMSGKLRIKGDMTMAIKLEKLMGRMNKAKL
uniref:Hydroxysteroid dehydrogenase-like protein 2 n=1 Tax=Takifugu rubripes TaxID=31033 RepID=A0A674MKU3_TAKRU